jgi:3-oxoacyl-[acyl-carrier protein] reductase
MTQPDAGRGENPFQGPELPSLAGRVALVTGGSGGIGKAISRGLAAGGLAVAVSYGSHASAAEELASRITAAGGRAAAFKADLREAEAAGDLVTAVEDALGPVDVLVSNAGLGRSQPLEEIYPGDFDEMIAVNLRAPFLLAQRCLPAMRERGFGRILFMSSVAAFTGGVVGPHYAASKAGLHGLTHFLAARFASHGITINALAPALITETGMLPGRPEELARKVPAGRLGHPDEVADMALAMLRNPYLTSQVVGLDGGMYPR